MTDAAAVVTTFLASLRPAPDGRIAPRGDLLAPDVGFTALLKVAGRDAVLARMTAADTGRIYREATWAPPEIEAGVVKIVGRLPAGSPFVGGAILLVRVADGRIVLIQQQPLPGAPMQATPLKLTAELKALVDNALVKRHPMLVSYVGDDGQPVLSFRGSTQALSDDQLAIWIRNAEGHFLASIRKNPKVALMYRDEDTKETFQFQGRAHIATDDATRQRVYERAAEAERNHDYARTGVALIIDLDKVEGWFGLTPDGPVNRVRMLRGVDAR